MTNKKEEGVGGKGSVAAKTKWKTSKVKATLREGFFATSNEDFLLIKKYLLTFFLEVK